MNRGFHALLWVLCTAAACRRSPAAVADAPGVPQVPDSVWVEVAGPTLVAFHPVVSNDSLERDEGLATALDDLAYHIGSAMDTLTALGVAVHYRGGDTLWLRTGTREERVVRAVDSADLGYLFADPAGHHAILYGVRTNSDLVAAARTFARTGTLPPG